MKSHRPMSSGECTDGVCLKGFIVVNIITGASDVIFTFVVFHCGSCHFNSFSVI